MTTPTSPAAALLAAQQAAFRNEGPVPASVRKQRLLTGGEIKKEWAAR